MKITDTRMKNWTVPGQGQSPLLTLPPEIRTLIFEHAFATRPNSDGRVMVAYKSSEKGIRTAPKYALALLGTCRMVYVEAAGIFFAQHHIELCISPGTRVHVAVHILFSTMSAARLDGIRKWTVQVDEISNVEMVINSISRFQALPKLERLTFKVMPLRNHGALRLYSCMDDFLVLRNAISKLWSVEELFFEFACDLPHEGRLEFRFGLPNGDNTIYAQAQRLAECLPKRMSNSKDRRQVKGALESEDQDSTATSWVWRFAVMARARDLQWIMDSANLFTNSWRTKL